MNLISTGWRKKLPFKRGADRGQTEEKAGRQRIILGKSAEEMDVPIKIDEGLYFEGKFDTEALLTMMTKKVLEPIGYDYSQIIIQYTDRVSMMSESNLIMSNEDVPDIEEMGQTQSMMRGM